MYVLKHIQRWFCLLAENKQLLNLSFNSIKNVLSNSGLKLSSEIEVYNAAERWIKHDPNERIKFAVKLIKLVRLPLLSSAGLNLLLKTENSFTKCPESKEYLKRVIEIKWK